MKGMTDEEKAMFPDYPIQIIEPAEISDEQLELLHSNLKLVFGFIKYSKDENALMKYVNSHDGFQNMDILAAQLINEVCAVQFEYKKNDEMEDMNMCKAIDDMKKHSREEGREEGEILTTLRIYHNMISKGMSEREARDFSGVTDKMLEAEQK